MVSSVGKDVAHGQPDVLDLNGLIQELIALSLIILEPISRFAKVNPGSLYVDGRRVLNEFGALGRAEVPHRVDILVLGQVLGDVIPLSSQDVDNTSG